MEFCRIELILVFLVFISCNKDNDNSRITNAAEAYQTTKAITYNGFSFEVVIDKPEGDELDVLMVFHGTVRYDSQIREAAHNALNGFKNILDIDDMMIVSMAYPQEGLLFGDNIEYAEAALLWLQNEAKAELEIDILKIFLAGHSQGGYLVTRLNTMHATDGVIANGPGPLNLVFRCQLEENGALPEGDVCSILNNEYGLPSANPAPYFERSLLNFTSGFKSDILFVQGLDDSPIQMHSWPTFKENLLGCEDCQSIQFLELEATGHNALFVSPQARSAFNEFINSRL